jgi:hypothetical protein
VAVRMTNDQGAPVASTDYLQRAPTICKEQCHPLQHRGNHEAAT